MLLKTMVGLVFKLLFEHNKKRYDKKRNLFPIVL